MLMACQSQHFIYEKLLVKMIILVLPCLTQESSVVDRIKVVEIAEKIAHHLINGSVSLEQNTYRSGSQYGFDTELMLLNELSFDFAGYKDSVFGLAQHIFPREKGAHVLVYSFDAKCRLSIEVAYPLPFKSAEWFEEYLRADFIVRMAYWDIAKCIRPFLSYQTGKLLDARIRDPRHPGEIKWESRTLRIHDFFNELLNKLLSWVPKSKVRDYDEYKK